MPQSARDRVEWPYDEHGIDLGIFYDGVDRARVSNAIPTTIEPSSVRVAPKTEPLD